MLNCVFIISRLLSGLFKSAQPKGVFHINIKYRIKRIQDLLRQFNLLIFINEYLPRKRQLFVLFM